MKTWTPARMWYLFFPVDVGVSLRRATSDPARVNQWRIDVARPVFHPGAGEHAPVVAEMFRRLRHRRGGEWVETTASTNICFPFVLPSSRFRMDRIFISHAHLSGLKINRLIMYPFSQVAFHKSGRLRAPIGIASNLSICTNTPPSDLSDNARTNKRWFANGYAEFPWLCSLDFCRRKKRIRQATALMGNPYMLDQASEETRKRVIRLSPHLWSGQLLITWSTNDSWNSD